MCLLVATLIALIAAAPDKPGGLLVTASITNNNFDANKNDKLCETPTCVHAASSILKNMDSNIDPCDNFYQFACGKFVEETPIPHSEPKVSTFREIDVKIEKQLQLIIPDGIKEDDPHVFQLIKSYYKTCMDTDQIEKNSEKDLREIFKNLGGCPVLEGQSWNEKNFDWIKSMYESNKMGYSTDIFIKMFIGVDPKNSNRRIVTIDQAETEPAREYLIEGKDEILVKAVLQAIIGVVEFLGADKTFAEKEVDDFLDFEMKLAKISLSYEERRNESKLNNRMTLHQLEMNYSGIAWADYLNELLAPYAHIDQNDDIIVAVPSFLESFPQLIAKTPKRVLANYVCIRTISQSIDNMGQDILNIKKEANKIILGIEELPPRWKLCFDNVYQYFFTAIGRLYVRHYFDKDAKANAVNLTKNLQNHLHNMIKEADWMDSKTKFAALEKLDSVALHVAYPDELDNDEKINQYFKDLTLHPNSFLRSEISLKQFERKKLYSLLRKAVDEAHWIVYGDVAKANAAYQPSQNSFDLQAGILQGHFYKSNRPNFMNYGAIGSIIGHELSHAFDDVGSQFDKRGNLVDWWKNETKRIYLEKVNCFVEQYGNYTVKEINMKINGFNTQDENIADNVGLKVAYLAYEEWAKMNIGEPRLPGLHYTPQQMFWISFANNWCDKSRLGQLKRDVISNTHAPAEFRVIGTVSNMPEFSKDFQCPLRSPMNPVKKCSVW